MFVLKMRAASTRYVGGWLQSFIAAVRGDIWGYAIVFLYSLLCIVLLALTGRFDLSSHERYLGQWTYLYLCIFPLFSVVLLMMRSLLRYQLQGVRICLRALSSYRTGKFAGGMAMMMGLMLFIGNFTTIKNLFPVMHDGFPFDRVTADVDQWLHFGHTPSELLYCLPGLSLALPFIELNYSLLWSVFCFGGLFFTVATARSPLMRMRYILMFMIVWIVCGNVLAGFFLSAGPVYYGAVTGDSERFAHIGAFLSAGSEPSSAAMFQSYLWTLYERGEAGFGSGISAFPSVHVALATMNALFLGERARWLGLLGAFYVAVILASSVLLGWHYAVDGYVSIAVVLLAHFALRHWLEGRGAAGEDRYWQPAAVPAE